jgi:hypothetical protein
MALPYQTRGTRTDNISRAEFNAVDIQEKKNQLAMAKAECKAKGGTWNEATQTCDLPIQEQLKGFVPNLSAPAIPTSPTVAQPTEKAKATQPEYIKDEKGNVTGLTLPDGRTFNNLSQKDINMLLGQYNQVPSEVSRQGIQPVGTFEAQVANQQRMQQLTQLAAQGLLTSQELAAIQGASPDLGQAAGAGAVGILPGIAAGAAGGALALGAPSLGIGAPLGAVIGGAAGAVSGFLIAMRGSIKNQQSEQFASDQAALTKGERYLRALVTDTNKNPQNAAENIALFYQTLNMIDMAHAKTFKDSQENLNKFLGEDGTTQLARFEVFDNTMRQYYIAQFQTALVRPNPNAIIITSEDLIENE